MHLSKKPGTFAYKTNFPNGERGIGAWEIAARYSVTDLSDGSITGGQEDDIVVGLNWYLNPNVRWMLNYVRAGVDGAGNADIFQMRFQLDF